MKNKIISCSYAEAEARIQPLLDSGWIVKQVSNENVFVSLAEGGYNEATSIRGRIIFLLEKK